MRLQRISVSSVVPFALVLQLLVTEAKQVSTDVKGICEALSYLSCTWENTVLSGSF